MPYVLLLSPTLAYRQINQRRLEYILPQATDHPGCILECIDFIEIEEKDVWINGTKFDLDCWSGESKVKLTKNGALEITYLHSQEFNLTMEWKERPLRHYAHISETNLKYSMDIEEEMIMMQIHYCFHVAVELMNLGLYPIKPKCPPRYKNTTLDTSWSDIIACYQRVIQHGKRQIHQPLV
eukprot:167076_1